MESDELAEFVDGVAQGLVAFQVGGNDDLPLHAEAVDRGRALGRFERRDARQLHQSRALGEGIISRPMLPACRGRAARRAARRRTARRAPCTS